MINPYEEGSPTWELFEVAEKLASESATSDEQANATDRLTIAIYRVGAELSSSFEYIGKAIQDLAEEVGNK